MKYCKACDTNKPKEDFHFDSSRPDELSSQCKKCRNDRNEANRKTKKGLSSRIYGGQKHSSRRRQCDPPNYNLKEFRSWLFSQENFVALYDNWVLSGYDKNMSPSADRLNDYLPYTLDNLQLVTWQENNLRGYSDRVKGNNNKGSKAIIQLTKDGAIIANHHSMSDAARTTGVERSNIGSCCRGSVKQAGGFLWEYAPEL